MAKARVVEKKFKPVTLEITFESQEELDLFGTIFNYYPICKHLKVEDDWCESISTTAESAGADISRQDELSDNLIEWLKKYDKL